MIESDGMSAGRADEQVLGEPVRRSSLSVEEELDTVVGLLGGAVGETIEHRLVVLHERIRRLESLERERMESLEREGIEMARAMRGHE